MTKRKLILNLAMSLDGYIAREDGSFDWIVGDSDKSHDTKNQFSFEDFLNTIDIVIMGKNAYEDMPKESCDMYDNKKVYVVTDKKLKSKLKDIEFINENILGLVKKLKKEKGKNIWVYGGAILAETFIKSNIIDEYIVGIIPIILGTGRKLFLDNNPEIKLHLSECTIQKGITILRYSRR